MSRVILVTGATGKQGGAVINALLSETRYKPIILAVTRDSESPQAQSLAAKSPYIKLVQGNLDDVPALFKEAQRVSSEPVWGVYSVQSSLGRGITVDSEVRQGKAMIDESLAAGVQHFVYSSVERGGDAESWDNPTTVPHFQSKYQIEHHLRDAAQGRSMTWTILRPVAFMDNLAPGFPTKVFLAALRNQMGEKPNQWVATRDIGIFAAKAFEDPEHWNHRAVGLAGDELTFEQLSLSFEKATGHPVPVAYGVFGGVLTYLVSEVRVMLQWFVEHGYRADVASRRKENPDMLTMQQWLINESGFYTKHRAAAHA
ncbi:NAD(P)-binding protein [Xylariaceae sp. FL1019]|nr:NAD(P)-binding protein [Xylariaceae sp. FL1019]